MKLRDRWHTIVEKKNSVLCAGIDPPPFAMGRGDKGLPSGISKRDWVFSYLEAVSPFCAAVKPNLQYWKGEEDPEILTQVYSYAGEYDLLVIEDSKLADIGSTNEAGIYHAARRSDAVTLAPFAGNMQEACRQAAGLNIGIIPMCLMSNPQYNREKMKLVPLESGDEEELEQYKPEDRIKSDACTYVPQYLFLAKEASSNGADAIVLGAPSDANHIQPEEIARAGSYCRNDMLVLAPGVGAQGGEASVLFDVFGAMRVIVNIGRALMFPHGSTSTPDQQSDAANRYKNHLNRVRRDRKS